MSMRWIPIFTIVVLLAATVFGQSLADVARKEKERQARVEKTRKVRVYTREDIERLREKVAISIIGRERATRPEATPRQTAPEEEELDFRTRRKIRAKQQEIERLQKELQRVEQQVNASMALYNATNFGTLIQRRNALRERIRRLQEEIRELRQSARREESTEVSAEH